MFDIAPAPDQPGFVATNEVWRVGGLTVSRVAGPPVRSARTAAHIKRSGIDHWVITVCRYGHTWFNANERDIRAPANVPFMWSMGESSVCLRSEMERLQLILSRDAFHGLGPLLDSMRGVAFNSPLGRMLGDYIVSLKDHLVLLNENDCRALWPPRLQ